MARHPKWRCNKSDLDAVKIIDIDEEGTYAYLVFKVFCPKAPNREDITIIRGYKRFKYHSECYEFIKTNLLPLHCEPMGGGKITFDPVAKKIHVFGTSAGFNQASHINTARMLKLEYPTYGVTAEKTGCLVPDTIPSGCGADRDLGMPWRATFK
ncbi:14 kDa phosphohistidine phosphatase-like [Hyposmocoma kahamanoa]|uniref:14 kDa phosphohistidine phosphatase-like n=1 Tax=Hyposmocoma kahamanoa TaxID=1477025 RepID=UPI000E6D8B37|nr:14 kDa phosphohistidine phosphatase-like [Hyposmocoma kahamanoa]